MTTKVNFLLFNPETLKYRESSRMIRSDDHLIEQICNFLRDGFHIVKMTKESTTK